MKDVQSRTDLYRSIFLQARVSIFTSFFRHRRTGDREDQHADPLSGSLALFRYIVNVNIYHAKLSFSGLICGPCYGFVF